MNLFRTGSQAVSDFVLRFCRVLSSSLLKTKDQQRNQAVLWSVEGVGAADDSSTDDTSTAGELVSDADVYGQIGMVARPLAPTGEEHAEAVCVQTVDGLVPIAGRDVRLRMPGNAPHEGTIASVGYGGAFHSFDPVDKNNLSKGTISTLYVPYSNNTKAHAVIIDPTVGNESISIVHGDGFAITIGASAMVLKNPTGSASICIDAAGITMYGQVNLVGPVVIGTPAAAVPLLPGVASGPCHTLFLSP